MSRRASGFRSYLPRSARPAQPDKAHAVETRTRLRGRTGLESHRALDRGRDRRGNRCQRLATTRRLASPLTRLWGHDGGHLARIWMSAPSIGHAAHIFEAPPAFLQRGKGASGRLLPPGLLAGLLARRVRRASSRRSCGDPAPHEQDPAQKDGHGGNRQQAGGQKPAPMGDRKHEIDAAVGVDQLAADWLASPGAFERATPNRRCYTVRFFVAVVKSMRRGARIWVYRQ